MASIPLEDLYDRFDATPADKLASLREVGGTAEQFISANEQAKRSTDRRLESYTYSSLLDLTTIADHQDTTANRTIRLIVIGLTGSGKSATANTLLQRDDFRESAAITAETMHSEMRTAEIDMRLVEVIDTPGSWNPPKGVFNNNDNEIYVLVVNLASPRFEERQLKKIRQLKDNRGRLIIKNRLCILLLTHAYDALSTINLTEYVHSIRGEPLEQLISEDLQGWKVLAINNKPVTEYEKRKQNQKLTKLIDTANFSAFRSSTRSQGPLVRRILYFIGGIAVVIIIVIIIYHTVF